MGCASLQKHKSNWESDCVTYQRRFRSKATRCHISSGTSIQAQLHGPSQHVLPRYQHRVPETSEQSPAFQQPLMTSMLRQRTPHPRHLGHCIRWTPDIRHFLHTHHIRLAFLSRRCRGIGRWRVVRLLIWVVARLRVVGLLSPIPRVMV